MNYEVLIGDCVDSMAQMPDESIDCVVTSPPYWNLRDYGVEGQIGNEDTPEDFVKNMVAVFKEIKRILKKDGTVWLNLGDSYASGKSRYSTIPQTFEKKRKKMDKKYGSLLNGKRKDVKNHPYLKDKDLIGIPWRVALALQADGWWLRQDIIWHKPDPMPESVIDRCTKAHEYIFLLTKSATYYFDHDKINERGSLTGKRRKRSVWTVKTTTFKDSHFAVFPPELIEPCILAGCPEGGTVLDPFGGSGTTAGVAIANRRNAIICELNEEYAELIEDRVASITNGWRPGQLSIFDWP